MEYKSVKELTYTQALKELEEIVRNLQSDTCDIDQLTAMTRRAIELLGECRSRLTVTDNELNTVLKTLE